MSRARRIMLQILLSLVALVAAMIVFGPYEADDLSAGFDESKLAEGVSVYFATQEAAFDDITPGTEKQVIWHGAPETRTRFSILYLHGFSASAQEIRPVPDLVAAGLDANLVFTRLRGHGRTGAAMAEAGVADWMADVVEALAAARAAGEQVIILSTSTGGTLATAVAVDPVLSQDVAGIVLISPNFGVNNPLAPLLTFPAARIWLPWIAGQERSFEPRVPAQATYWTTRYPSVATLPMAALVRKVGMLDLSPISAPALFIYSDADTVVRADITAEVVERWGGPVRVAQPVLGPEDDPDAHVIAGDILSPAQTDWAAQVILDWAGAL